MKSSGYWLFKLQSYEYTYKYYVYNNIKSGMCYYSVPNVQKALSAV
jgi:hypothetical protein